MFAPNKNVYQISIKCTPFNNMPTRSFKTSVSIRIQASTVQRHFISRRVYLPANVYIKQSLFKVGKSCLAQQNITNDVTSSDFFLNNYKCRFRSVMKLNAGGAEYFWEDFRPLVETQNRHVDSNPSIFFKNIDDTIHTMITIFYIFQLFGRTYGF